MTTNVTIKNNGPGKIKVRGVPPVTSGDDPYVRGSVELEPQQEYTMAVYKEQNILVEEI